MKHHPLTQPLAAMQRVTLLVALIGLIGLLFLAAMTVAEVIIRWLFNYGVPGVADVSSLVIAVSLASGFGLVCSRNRHISVRFLGEALGPRASCILDAFGALVTLGVFSVVTWQMGRYALELVTLKETTWVLLWPKAPWFMVVTLLLALTIPSQLLVFLMQLVKVVTHKKDNV